MSSEDDPTPSLRLRMPDTFVDDSLRPVSPAYYSAGFRSRPMSPVPSPSPGGPGGPGLRAPSPKPGRPLPGAVWVG